jgi:hypothetical protein
MAQLTLVLGMVFLFIGCTPRASIREVMQPDHSYKIEVVGAWSADSTDLSGAAIRRAWQLCPKGYVKEAEYPEDAYYSRFYMVVSCKNKPPGAPQGTNSSNPPPPARGNNGDDASAREANKRATGPE